MSRPISVCCCLLLLFAAAAPLSADDIDILSIAGVDPNVLILLDSSGSMNDSIDGTPKITIAKQVVTNLIASTDGVRFGVMKFKANGGEIVSPIGTAKGPMIAAVNAMTTTSVGTPLGDMLYDAGRYFKGTLPAHSSPILFECQVNFVILVSDGLQTSSTRDVRDEATLRFTQDHKMSLSGTQNVLVQTVSFGIDDTDLVAKQILADAASNGGGVFFLADDATELEASLTAAIQAISAARYSFAMPLVPSTSVTGSNRAFQAAFLSDSARPVWRGYLSAYDRGTDGKVPVDANGVPLATARAWEAGLVLNAATAASRTIFTSVAGSDESFTTANAAITAGALNAANATERARIIDFVRGVDAYDEDGDSNTTEPRSWKLGDILHSRPVLVSAPPLLSNDPAYVTFKQANAARTPVVIVGANDGMLHAFRESDGQELWGFVPPDLLGKLKQLTPATGPHVYFVDSSPIAADVKFSGTYKTVVLFGERRGGRRYHALDVTDTTSPSTLWSFIDAKSAESWSMPAVGRVKLADNSVRTVAFVGGGYDTSSNNATGKALFVIDVETGLLLWQYYNDGTSDDRQRMNFSLAASPTALDLNGDGFVDRVYAGDVGGQLWKFDVSAPATLTAGLVDNWSGKRLFAANPGQANPPPAGPYSPAQAIYGAPAAALDELGDLWVFFGTGDLNHPVAASQNRFYGLRDDTDMVNGNLLTETSLVDVTSTDGAAAQGWFFQLASDEKVFSGADVFDRTVYFTTFEPEAATSCESGGGPARLYAIDFSTGYAALDWATGERLDPSDSSETRFSEMGEGIPSSPIVVAVEDDGGLDPEVVTATSGEQLEGVEVPDVMLRHVLYWREVF